jgi:hypothetical protein
MDFTQYGSIAQIVTSIISVVGIVTSIWLSTRALREVQTDRKLRQRPFLGFEIGGYDIPIEFQKAGKTIPGIDPEFVKKMFPDIPEDAESVRIKQEKDQHASPQTRFYGQLRNYGLGPALSTTVTWIPTEIWTEQKKTQMDRRKLLEPQFMEVLNCMPSVPSHIMPGSTAALARLATFIEKDFRKTITRAEGTLRIECKDVFGINHTVNQTFYLFTYYKTDPPHAHVTFSDFNQEQREQ